MEKPLEIVLQQSAYQPGAVLEGELSWAEQPTPAELSLSLLWHTSGKGTEDAAVVETKTINLSSASGGSSFSFKLPEAPYSFSGSLISLIWAVEAVVLGQNESSQAEFVLSPAGREITLTPVPK